MNSSPPKIVCVVPTIRETCHARFVEAWKPLFEKHRVTLVTVWDGDRPTLDQRVFPDGQIPATIPADWVYAPENRDLFCRRTDACRNLGFVAAAMMKPDYVLTLDDDVVPVSDKWGYEGQPFHGGDPIQAHIDALSRRVPLSWMNTAHDTDLYLRGVPYGVRAEAPVMLSHGVWVGTPDFDGETQLWLEQGSGVPHSLPYYVGPIPRGVMFPLCGMSVMVRAEALPYLYYAPMGADSGVPDLHRFADIFMGVFLKREFDRLGWACVTGYSTVHHTRASDARKNFQQEKLGREWMERIEFWEDPYDNKYDTDDVMWNYFMTYADKRTQYEDLVRSLLEETA